MNAHYGHSAVKTTSFSLIDGGPLHPAMGHDNGPLSSKTSRTEVYTSQNPMSSVEIGGLGSIAQQEDRDRFCLVIILWKTDPAENSQDDHFRYSGMPVRLPTSPGTTPIGSSQLLQGPVREVAAAAHEGTHLVAVVVHGNQAVGVVDVAASGQLSHQVRLDRGLRALVAGGGREALHADGTVLRVAGTEQTGHQVPPSLGGWSVPALVPE